MNITDRYGNVLENADIIVFYPFLKKEASFNSFAALLAPKKDSPEYFQQKAKQQLDYEQYLQNRKRDEELEKVKQKNIQDRQQESPVLEDNNSDKITVKDLKSNMSDYTKDKTIEIPNKAKLTAEMQAIEKDIIIFEKAKQLNLQNFTYDAYNKIEEALNNNINLEEIKDSLTERVNLEEFGEMNKLKQKTNLIQSKLDKVIEEQNFLERLVDFTDFSYDESNQSGDYSSIFKDKGNYYAEQYNKLSLLLKDPRYESKIDIIKEKMSSLKEKVMFLRKVNNIEDSALKNKYINFVTNRIFKEKMMGDVLNRQELLESKLSEMNDKIENIRNLDVVQYSLPDGSTTTDLNKMIENSKKNISNLQKVYDELDLESKEKIKQYDQKRKIKKSFFNYFLVKNLDKYEYPRCALISSNDIIKVSNVNIDLIINNIAYELSL
jgi:hypothetical protein